MARTFDFSNPDDVASYRQGPGRFCPGYEAMQRLTAALLALRCRDNARVLVLGAGGGLELKAFAQDRPAWTFVGVDPSESMLDLARAEVVASGIDHRVELHQGYIPEAPEGPFDAATCLLTLHFVPDDGSKLAALRAIRSRLKPGAPFAVVDLCIDLTAEDAEARLDDYAAFPRAAGADEDQIRLARDTVRTTVNVISPEREAELLAEAGFRDLRLYWAAHAWRGWMGTA
ncbi:class I SAM-dependent methyltransferase [Brevundimonas sp.]|jgi:tRNA (cmo5U34)-methyltransferase|uniref:class I SAM-dependent methyltransferase n=1 Tax=Brevundimonas sp. TaxID=1871086 RepID=UPI002E0D6ACE|nr:class I SAM-dependent methyltransferase [Brevundimonas sp.]